MSHPATSHKLNPQMLRGIGWICLAAVVPVLLLDLAWLIAGIVRMNWLVISFSAIGACIAYAYLNVFWGMTRGRLPDGEPD